jgi:hypothetical protein
MALKLKLDANGHVVVQDGKPVYIDDVDNKEIAYDVDQMRKTIAIVNEESRQRRLKIDELTGSMSKHGNVTAEEVAAAFKTIEELGGAEGIAKLKEKGKVDIEAVKKSISDAYEAKLTTAGQTIAAKDNTIVDLMVGSQFNSSEFITKKLVIPPDMARAKFGQHFKIENGQVVAYMGEHPITSRDRPGQNATFDEAMAEIVGAYPYKEQILRGANASGGGAGGGGGPQDFGSVKSRADLKTPADKAKFISDNGLDAFKGLPEK